MKKLHPGRRSSGPESGVEQIGQLVAVAHRSSFQTYRVEAVPGSAGLRLVRGEEAAQALPKVQAADLSHHSVAAALAGHTHPSPVVDAELFQLGEDLGCCSPRSAG